MFPIDPTPYVMLYIFVVFCCPWFIFSVSLTHELLYLRKNTSLGWSLLNTPSVMRAASMYRKNDPVAERLHNRVIRSLIFVATCWVVGLMILFLTLYFMETNNLLINHSKGIYK